MQANQADYAVVAKSPSRNPRGSSSNGATNLEASGDKTSLDPSGPFGMLHSAVCSEFAGFFCCRPDNTADCSISSSESHLPSLIGSETLPPLAISSTPRPRFFQVVFRLANGHQRKD